MQHPYLSDEACVERLMREYQTHGSICIAYDFDDTVYDFHQKGRKYTEVVELLRRAKAANCYLIVWTGNEDMEMVRAYLADNDIPYDSINENPPFWKGKGRKLYANLYLDDRAGLPSAFYQLERMLDIVSQS
jgi:predicted HAD superfamily phosphohydrolase YqeG